MAALYRFNETAGELMPRNKRGEKVPSARMFALGRGQRRRKYDAIDMNAVVVTVVIKSRGAQCVEKRCGADRQTQAIRPGAAFGNTALAGEKLQR